MVYMTDFTFSFSSLLSAYYSNLPAFHTVITVFWMISPPLVFLYPKITCYTVRHEPMNTMFKILTCKNIQESLFCDTSANFLALHSKHQSHFHDLHSAHYVGPCQFSELFQLLSIVSSFIWLQFFLSEALAAHPSSAHSMANQVYYHPR